MYPKCAYANDFDFSFCSKCGRSRFQQIPNAGPTPDEAYITRRLQELEALGSARSYSVKVDGTAKLFGDFLASRSHPKRIWDATPHDIIEFAISREPKSHTQLHVATCIFLGQRGRFTCGCRFGMPPDSFRQIKAKLSSFFTKASVSGDWNAATATGNPAKADILIRHQSLLAEEAARHSITPKKAVVFFSDKILRVVHSITALSFEPSVSTTSVLVYLMDIAALNVLFATGMRGQDLANVLATNVTFAPQDAGLFLRSLWEKTLRDGQKWVMAPAVPSNYRLCPVWAVRRYINAANAANAPHSPFFFRDHSPAALSAAPLDPAKLNARIQRYLTGAGVFAGESLHGIRAAKPVERCIWEGDADAAFGESTWKTRKVQESYMELIDVLTLCYAGPSTGRAAHDLRLQAFRDLNTQQQLVSVADLLRAETSTPAS